MSLHLYVETSTPAYSVGLADGAELVAQVSGHRNDPGYDGVAGVVGQALAAAGATHADVTGATVDVGPGNLISVRAGIAYVNGLAFARGFPVTGADAFELLATEVRSRGAAGVVLCLRKAGGSRVYAGVLGPGEERRFATADLAELPGLLPAGADEVTVAGAFRDRAAELLPGVKVTDSGVEAATAATLHTWRLANPGTPGGDEARLTPLTENSAVFGG